MAVTIPTGQIDTLRAERMAGSAALHARARNVFPDGVTHDGRYMEPFAIYCTHAQGPRKWDVQQLRNAGYPSAPSFVDSLLNIYLPLAHHSMCAADPLSGIGKKHPPPKRASRVGPSPRLDSSPNRVRVVVPTARF